MNKKFRAEVIETYPAEGKAAVRFSWRGRERVECVPLRINNDGDMLNVGTKGWASYWVVGQTGAWGFAPFKKAGAA